jgi:hypothetical protein
MDRKRTDKHRLKSFTNLNLINFRFLLSCFDKRTGLITLIAWCFLSFSMSRTLLFKNWWLTANN